MPLDRLLFLIGYRGTGKTTVARALADALGTTAEDSDVVLQQREGRPIAEVFKSHGEVYFRDLEQATVAELAAGAPRVVSLGGGAVLREANRQALAGHHVVWLRATPGTIAQRLVADEVSVSQRPSLTGKGLLEEIDQVLAERTPIYEECATITVDTDRLSPAEIADQILRQLALPRP